MQVDGDTIMWAFGLVFAAFSGLAGLVWGMLNRRITTIEDQARVDRRNTYEMVQNIYMEIKASRRESEDGDQRIFDEIHGMRESVGKLATATGERRAGCVEKFATKDELNRGLESVRQNQRGVE